MIIKSVVNSFPPFWKKRTSRAGGLKREYPNLLTMRFGSCVGVIQYKFREKSEFTLLDISLCSHIMFNVINLHFWPYICILITKNYQQRTSKFKFKRYQKKTINACDHRLLIEYMNRSCVYSAKNSKKIIEFLQSEQVSVRATNVLKLHSNNKIQNLLPIFNTFL